MSDDSSVVRIFDTTLRDGEQSPGASLSVQEKIDIAHQLKRLGVDIIEAGFPVSSPAQFEAVERISEEVDGPTIAALARAVPLDIETAARAVKPAKKKRIHTFIATSPIHMERKLKKTPAEVLKLTGEAVRLAKSFCDDVEFSPEDAGRSEWPFLVEVLTAAIEAGATTLNIPDTVGYMMPDEYGRMIAHLIAHVPGSENVIYSTHCHNDLGLAVANSIAGVVNGARQVECTINGLGERAGNAAMEEFVMALRTRQDVFKLRTNIVTTEITRTSRMVARCTGLPVQANKAIVGANAFAHESGIHQDGVLKARQTYEIMTPESVGLDSTRLVLGRHSGRHGFKARLEKLGYRLDKDALERAYERFLAIADRKKEVFDEDLAAIVGDEFRDVPEVYKLDYMHCISGSKILPSATVRIIVNGEVHQESEWGDGPVDAVFRAISKVSGFAITLDNYTIRAVTAGTDAIGEVTLRVRDNGHTVTGRGASTDIVEASARAYVDGLNKLAAWHSRVAEQDGNQLGETV
ncbi:MAG TPA: 2-isopropylmalate synthase [Candidatus Latescibacteria bacterium]|nr:2-isopropylmalate synthase [Candidatus Latescibacterota bacterium]